MRYLSVCSGIEAASVAWRELDWHPVAFAEIDNFPSSVLAHHFPNVPNFGDLLDYEKWPIERGAIDVICGGPPCQSFSVAGKRGGMEDERGDLARTFFLLARRLRPEWIVFENVPGILSSAGGADFRSLLQTLTESGYGYAYRILDAQHFGVAQRRRRLYLVANATDWRRAAAILFEPESLRGNFAPRSQARKSAPARTGERVEIVGTLCADSHPGSYAGQDAYTGRLIPAPIPLQDGREIDKSQNGLGIGREGDPSYTLDTTGAAAVATPYAVRRLTPTECERLQGFPDDWTAVPYRGKPAADGPRYKAIGNSMAVPVMKWIGERIDILQRSIEPAP